MFSGLIAAQVRIFHQTSGAWRLIRTYRFWSAFPARFLRPQDPDFGSTPGSALPLLALTRAGRLTVSRRFASAAVTLLRCISRALEHRLKQPSGKHRQRSGSGYRGQIREWTLRRGLFNNSILLFPRTAEPRAQLADGTVWNEKPLLTRGRNTGALSLS